ncbi:NAD(P)/FAD-dependent oxidoreductase [Mycobacterium sp. 155]|uniref:protoporphyrinogen/coproporphyrinogen oxidase n=1 Tax=Mycobacterium sp. 155 TaxID=1157943 RepID=UPI00035FC780|nr:FAD-dependent oxidoreductase [Mycobacterium sp. 155]
MTNVAILGSGMAGFGASHRLRSAGLSPVMFEKLPHYGGHTSSHEWHGFMFDEGPHVSFTSDTRIQELLADNIDGAYETLHAKINNLWRGHWIKHPAQVNLHGLPEDLVVDVIKDFVAVQDEPARKFKNYQEWLYAAFGKTFAETFPMEYAYKYHTTTADNMSTDWLGPRFYRPSLDEVLRGALGPNTPHTHYVDYFRYPTRGGFAAYLRRFAQDADVRTSHEVSAVDPKRRLLTFRNGQRIDYTHLISSIPLKTLVPMIEGTPPDVLDATDRLACTEVVLVNVGVDRADLLDAHWSYYYDREITFTRLSTPHLLSPNNAPTGCGSLQAECYFSAKYRPLDRSPDSLIEPVLRDLRKCGILRESDRIIFANTLHIPYANIIFDLDRAAALETVHGYLADIGIAWCGRYGEWGYQWTDEAFVSGENAAEQVLNLIGH